MEYQRIAFKADTTERTLRAFDAQSADAAWRQAASSIIGRVGTHEVGSRAGDTIEMLHASVSISNPRARWVPSRLPAINIAFAIAEVVQILAGADDVPFLEHWFPGYGKFVGGGARAAGAYGVRLRGRWGFDQLDRAAAVLSANGETRQVVLSIWDPRDDLPSDDGVARSGDIPCNVLSCLRLVNGRLHWLQTCRSNDLFRGLPYNVVQFTFIQEVIAGWLGVEVGGYSHAVSSLHAYTSALQKFTIDTHPPALLESIDIRLPRLEAVPAWKALDRLARELIARPKSSRPSLLSANIVAELGPLQSMFWILAAEDARRRGWSAESQEAAGRCEDSALSNMWDRWTWRF
jgi:thymidylate synthase